MQMDKSLMFLDDDAFGTIPEILHLDVLSPAKGQQMRVHLGGVGVTGITDVVVKTGATSATAATTVATIPATPDQVNAGMSFYVPIESEEYITIVLTGITAGTVSSGIVFDTQTAA